MSIDSLETFSSSAKADINKYCQKSSDNKIKYLISLIGVSPSENDAIQYFQGMDKALAGPQYAKFVKLGVIDKMLELINKFPQTNIDNLFIVCINRVVTRGDEDIKKFVLFTKDIIPNLVNLYLGLEGSPVEAAILITTITELALMAAQTQAYEEIKYIMVSPLVATAISRLPKYDLRMQFSTLRMLYTLYFLPSKVPITRVMVKGRILPVLRKLIIDSLHKLDDEGTNEGKGDKGLWNDVYGVISVSVAHINSLNVDNTKIPKDQLAGSVEESNVAIFRDVLKFIRSEQKKLEGERKITTNNNKAGQERQGDDRPIKLMGLLKLLLGFGAGIKKEIQTWDGEDLMTIAEEAMFDGVFGEDGVITCIREFADFYEEDEGFLKRRLKKQSTGMRPMLSSQHAKVVEAWVTRNVYSKAVSKDGKKLIEPEAVLTMVSVIIGMSCYWNGEEECAESFNRMAMLLPGLLRGSVGMPRVTLSILTAMKYAVRCDERLKNHYIPDAAWAYTTFKKQTYLSEESAALSRAMHIYKADDPVFKFAVLFVFCLVMFAILLIIFGIKYRRFIYVKYKEFMLNSKLWFSGTKKKVLK